MASSTKRITLSHKDKLKLKERFAKCKEIEQQNQPANYKNKVVIKPWGHEFLIFENENVAIWLLYIKKDHSTSMHSHPMKRTSLVLLSGNALCNTFRYRNFLSAGEAVIIEAAVFHGTKALSLEGIHLLEIEAPPDKLDLVRLEDNYGRRDTSFEGINQMATENLQGFNYFYFENDNCLGKKYGVGPNCSVSMEFFKSDSEFKRNFTISKSSIYCVCKGTLLEAEGSIAVDTGETESGTYLEGLEGLKIDSETLFMKIELNKTL